MEVVFRKNISEDLKPQILNAIEKVKKFLTEKYPNTNLENVGYIFSKTYSRSRYFRNNEQSRKPNVCICARAKLYLYEKRSLKLKNYNAFIGIIPQIECALVHELTHHVQYEQNYRKGNELDTTKNEVEYLKKYYPKQYLKLI